MKNLASVLLHSNTQSRVFHLRVSGHGSNAIHKTLEDYYDAIVDIVDTMVEAYQGKYGLVEFTQPKDIDNNAELSNIVKYFQLLAKFVESERDKEYLKDQFVQADIDSVEKLIYTTLYKLKKLQ
jgi:DNA-binding ferritin-like protein